MLNTPGLDAVCLATPVGSHFSLAMKAIEAGKHVLVEKPMAATAEEARLLRDAAVERQLTLMVGHTFVYTGAVRKIKELVSSGELVDIYYYDGVRANLGLFQHDVNVLWNLAIHDLSILDFVIGKTPTAVSATGLSQLPGQWESVAYLTLFYEENLIAHLHVNWLVPVKIRRTIIGGSKKMIIYDDLEPSEKVKIYDTGYDLKNDEDKRKILVDYRTGDIYTPKIDRKEALAGVSSDFINAINTGQNPVSNSESGLAVVRILEASQHSIKHMGAEVVL